MITLDRWSRLCPVSQIRQLRITLRTPPGHNLATPPMSALSPAAVPSALARYVRAHEENSQLHVAFWSRNNDRFARELRDFRQRRAPEEDESVFYKGYMERHRQEFHEYHLQTWRRSFALILLEYQWIVYQTRHTLLGLYHGFARRVLGLALD